MQREKLDTPRKMLIQEVWVVFDAAKDVSDVPTQLICRRVIEAHLDCKQPRLADIAIVKRYFA